MMAVICGAMTTALILTVDVEEEGLWSGSFRPAGNTVENTRGIERFQSLCDRFELSPTYFVDTPVVEDERSVAMLRRLREDGRCEIGSHLHAWCAPPFEEPPSPQNRFLCNLPASLQRAKIATLTQRIAERFGRPPLSFRAGRYGLDAVGARILGELGYRVDSSVLPFFDYSEIGGPDFTRAPWTPYYVGAAQVCEAASSGLVLEVPISVGFNRSRFRHARRLRELALHQPWRSLRAVGMLDRLGIVRRIKFSPEQSTAADMKRLIDVYLAQGASCMVMTLHSSSLVAGFSPYVRDAAELARLYADLESILHYALVERRMSAHTLERFAQNFELGERASTSRRDEQPASQGSRTVRAQVL